MRIELSWQDLTRVSLAAAADPLGELTSSLQILQRRDGSPHRGSAGFHRWRHRVRHGLPDAASVLLWLCRPDAPVPEFLAPPGRPDLDSALAAVLQTDPLCLKTSLRAAPPGRDLPEWAAGLADGDPAGLPHLVQTMRDYFELALAPGWATARSQIDADLAMRTQLLLRAGVDALLTSLHPRVHWLAPVLEADDPTGTAWTSHGTGLLLVPTYFSLSPALLPATGTAPARLRYPPIRATVPANGSPGRSIRRRDTPALADLLGPTRAAALTVLAVGCSTSELAARLGVTPSAVSKHTTVLRQAGLIFTHRDRNTVLHTLTPLGSALLDH